MEWGNIQVIFMNTLQKLVDILYSHHNRLGITYFQLNNNILTASGQEYLTFNAFQLRYYYLAKWRKMITKRLKQSITNDITLHDACLTLLWNTIIAPFLKSKDAILSHISKVKSQAHITNLDVVKQI